MKFTALDWKRLSGLLDRAMDLPPAQRKPWLDSLDDAHADLREPLSEILFGGGGPETGDFLQALPQFSTVSGTGPLAASEVSAGDIVGAYRLLRELGSGGTASVWLAERADGTLQRQFALKFPHVGHVDRGLAERMARERDILTSLDHPNIARLYDAGLDDKGRPYLALEFVDGISPDEYCKRHECSLRQRLGLFLQVARAVAYAHARLVVHRDLKPNNILVTAAGEVRLLDFGIARLLEGDRAAAAFQTQVGLRALTPAYAAPEQFLGQPITVASDVYSLGVVLFELLTGRSPYTPKRPTLSAIEQAALEDDVPLASSIAPDAIARALRGDLDTILSKALAREPRMRYSSVESFAGDIQHFLAGEPIQARVASIWYVGSRFVRRNRVMVASALAISVVLVVVASVAVWQARLATREARRAEEVNTFVLSLLKAARPSGGGGTELRVVDLLAQSLSRIEQELEAQPAQQLELYVTVGQGLNELNAPRESIAAFDKALVLARRDSLETATAAIDAKIGKAQALVAMDDLTGAAALLADAERSLEGRPSVSLASVWKIRSYVELNSDEADNAVRSAAKAAALLKTLRGETDNEYLDALMNLSRARYHADRCAEAMPDIDFAMKQLPRTLRTATHPFIATFRGVRARCLKELGRNREALAEFDANDSQIKIIYGEQSRDYAITLLEHSGVALSRGESRRATALATQALAIIEHAAPGGALGANAPAALMLALLQARRPDLLAEAARHWHRRVTAAPDGSNYKRMTVMSQAMLAVAEGLQGDVTRARKRLEELEGEFSNAGDSLRPRMQSYRAWLEILDGRALQARDSAQGAIDFFESRGTIHALLLAEARARQGLALLDLNEIDRAQETLRAALDAYERLMDVPIADHADVWIGLARVALIRRDLGEALKFAARADEFWASRDEVNRWAGEAAYWHGHTLVLGGNAAAGNQILRRAAHVLGRSPLLRDRQMAAQASAESRSSR